MNDESSIDLRNAVMHRHPSAISSDLDGETVILDMESGKYHSLDTTGTRIWELLQNRISLNDIVLQLVDEYSVGQEQCITDVTDFIQKMLASGLVITETP